MSAKMQGKRAGSSVARLAQSWRNIFVGAMSVFVMSSATPVLAQGPAGDVDVPLVEGQADQDLRVRYLCDATLGASSQGACSAGRDQRTAVSEGAKILLSAPGATNVERNAVVTGNAVIFVIAGQLGSDRFELACASARGGNVRGRPTTRLQCRTLWRNQVCNGSCDTGRCSVAFPVESDANLCAADEAALQLAFNETVVLAYSIEGKDGDIGENGGVRVAECAATRHRCSITDAQGNVDLQNVVVTATRPDMSLVDGGIRSSFGTFLR